jgi:hypothetical protein
MGDINTLSNIYWSLRRYIYETLPAITAMYAANQLPIPSSGDSWIVVQEMDSPRIDRITIQNFRIHCVVRNNPNDEPLQNLKTTVVNAFENTTKKKYISVYDKATGGYVGQMWVDDMVVRPAILHEGGISSKAVDISLRYLAKRHA